MKRGVGSEILLNRGALFVKAGHVVLVCIILAAWCPRGTLWAVEISDDPMETKVQSAPPNIMFVLDNSGSMDWEFMTADDEGIFHSEYYLFDLADNTYSSDNVLSGTKKLEWKSQWYGFNTIYYNPHTTYHPWPRWEQMANTEDANGVKIKDGGTPPPHEADLQAPRSNPINRTPTLDLYASYYEDIPTNNFLVVDNQDGTPYFSTIGTWNESSPTPEWNGSSVYTSTEGDMAVFQPDIPVSGQYYIYAFWNCYNNRDRNALLELDTDNDGNPEASQRRNQRSSSSNVPEAGICGEWLPLFGGGTFDLPAGQQAVVRIIRDDPDGNSTIADAIAFSRTPLTATQIDISNAHYYMVHDADGDGVADPGEVYLVNFSWDDQNGDSVVDDGEVSRNYYLVVFSDDPDPYQKVQYVQPVLYDPADPQNDDVPDAIQPKVFNEDGSISSFVSDFGDIQNFANWFSFYRRRELTAKAAVSRSNDKLEAVKVGYYTLHDSGGVRQTVLPIKVNEGDAIVVDNLDSGFSSTPFSWWESSPDPEYNGSCLYTVGFPGGTARWTPNIPATGTYKVSAWWNCYAYRDQKAKFTIHHAGGDTVKYLNQRASSTGQVTTKADCEDSSGSGCCGYWVDLGSYTFTAGTGGYVEVERHGGSTGDSTAADAVRFEGTTSSLVDKTDELLDKLYSIDSAGGTPLRSSLQDVGQYFDQDDGDSGNLGPSPFLSEAEGGACQQSFAIAMTDGYWNGSLGSIGNVDGDKGAPYADDYADTLADVAMYYYDRDLSAALPNHMPVNNYDKKKTQHMVTFSVSFGLDGEIDMEDMDGDGITDSPGYGEDPYFLNPATPLPSWPNPADCWSCPKKIDDLWHASVNGRGRFFLANDPDSLVDSLSELFKDISTRTASGASVSVNGEELSTGLVLYQSSFSAGTWVGDVLALPVDPVTGEIRRGEDDIIWSAQNRLQNMDWDTDRLIITYNGTAGVPFRYEMLATGQQKALDNDPTLVDYLRGKEIAGFRSRTKKLGDIVHSAPLLVGTPVEADADGLDNDEDGLVDEPGEMRGGTIFVGGNDGMLHAFDAQSGRERFAYLPLHAFDYLRSLAEVNFSHRFFVDATPFVQQLTFLAGDRTMDELDNDGDGSIDEPDEDYGDNLDNDGDGEVDEPDERKSVRLLVGALKKGGRGIYCLDVTDIEGDGLTEEGLSTMVKWEYPPIPTQGLQYSYVGDQSHDGADNDGDGYHDLDSHETDDGMSEDYSDGLDNDGDGEVDEEGEMAFVYQDDDMGYSFSDPVIVRSYKSFNETDQALGNEADNPWIVVFGNGYGSKNGHAVLYILDAWTGTLLRKIDTGASGNNGLSTVTAVDVDNDRRVDFVYGGDLLGNMWKFDLTDRDPENWGVSFGSDIPAANPAGKQRIDWQDESSGLHDTPEPLFSASGQPITTAADVMYHPTKPGYLVIFGTGRFLGEPDRSNTDQQTIFGIWDYDDKHHHDPAYNLGSWNRTDGSLSNPLLSGVKLLEQTEVDWQYLHEHYLRTISDNPIHWYTRCDDGIDNNNDGLTDDDSEACIPVSPGTAYLDDHIDNDGNGEADETDEGIGHVGWYFDLPYLTDGSDDGLDNDGDGDIDESGEMKRAGERVIKDVFIRDGRAIVISFIPEDSPCTGGGKSIVHEFDATDGSRLKNAVFDINNDGRITDDDLVDIGLTDNYGNPLLVPPTGRMYDGMLHSPTIVRDPNQNLDREMKVFSSSAGTTVVLWEKQEQTGFYYWRER